MEASAPRDYDEIEITGTCTSAGRPFHQPFRVVRLRGVVGCAYREGGLKVWPDEDPQLTPDDLRHGKLYFLPERIESVTVVRRREED